MKVQFCILKRGKGCHTETAHFFQRQGINAPVGSSKHFQAFFSSTLCLADADLRPQTSWLGLWSQAGYFSSCDGQERHDFKPKTQCLLSSSLQRQNHTKKINTFLSYWNKWKQRKSRPYLWAADTNLANLSWTRALNVGQSDIWCRRRDVFWLNHVWFRNVVTSYCLDFFQLTQRWSEDELRMSTDEWASAKEQVSLICLLTLSKCCVDLGPSSIPLAHSTL